MCYCGLPCDVRNGYTVNGDSDGTIAYFRCPKKNFWSDLVEKIEIIDEDPCNFYKEYGGEMDILRDLDIRVKPFGDIKVNDRGDVISDNKKYIQVPYRDKEIAKDLKCKWDPDRKSWFCQSDNIEALKRWKLNK